MNKRAADDGAGSRTVSFMVRIWIEETAQEAGRTIWRGYIRHIPSGERHYIRSPNDVGRFAAQQLESIGVHTSVRRQITHWLEQQVRRLPAWARRQPRD
jgi:hypothetical protein